MNVHRPIRPLSAKPLILLSLVLALAGLNGCAKVQIVKAKVGTELNQLSSTLSAPDTGSSADTASPHDTSLRDIVNDDLQNGHYAEGEQALRRYLKEHPGDRTAQSLLDQLTADPEQRLGAASTPHVVQPGESYSTLAARYLGDSRLFLILARYNHSTNPSLLRAGATLRMPASGAGASIEAPESQTASTSDAANTGSPSQRAQRLQDQSVALYKQGQTDRAMALLGQALTLDPRLKPSGATAESMHKQLVANYHQRAIVLYRDQHLDQAIALWNQVLAIDPDYEPAQVYRARAINLKQRLQQY